MKEDPMRNAVKPALALILLGLTIAVDGGGGAAGVPPSTLAPPESKVSRVLVYSNQAQVFRVASVTLGAGAQEVAVADLPEAIVPDTVKVECKSAEVVRVEVSRTRANLPRQTKAKEMLAKVEALLASLRAIADERSVLHAEISYLGALGLHTLPVPRDGKPAAGEGLFAEAWRRILGWADGRAGKARARLLALAGETQKQQRALHALRVEAQGLDLNAGGEPVLRVRATLRGAGKHQVTVSYLVSSVRWSPAYDLGYDHRRRAVDATYYAIVSQTTGEDWENASLEFSTGMPTHLVAVPELPTWTLGRKRDFTPTPRARVEPRATAWSPPPRSETVDPVVAELQSALAEGERQAPSGSDQPVGGPRGYKNRQYDFDDSSVEGKLMRPEVDRLRSVRRAPYQAPPPPPMAKPAPAPEPVVAAEAPARDEAEARPYPSSPAPRRAYGGAAATVSRSTRNVPPTESLPWTDQGYSPPYVDPDSPAAGAQGYLFTLYAPGRHTIPATGASRRVPLLRRRIAVSPVYLVRAGVSPAAYLTASVENVTGKPILRGPANLFAGAMFAGSSWINTALPGKKIVLSLGVDDAIKVVRHLRQKTVSEGVVFKDDITEYTVDVEIANHRRHAISIEVEDQLPLKQGEKVEVRGFSSQSFAKPEEHTGKVRWKGKISPSTVKKLSFSFQILRPKDWELSQQGG
jgi:hypothetical protein